jgi:hypothetical protein
LSGDGFSGNENSFASFSNLKGCFDNYRIGGILFLLIGGHADARI